MTKKWRKRLYNLLLFLGFIFYVVILASCGPSKEEIEAWEKKKEDSINHINALKLQALEQAKLDAISRGEELPDTARVVLEAKLYGNNSDLNIIIYGVNGCEYILFKGVNILHAGNCNNPIHGRR